MASGTLEYWLPQALDETVGVGLGRRLARARSDKRPGGSALEDLFERFGLTGSGLPVAAVSRAGDTDVTDPRIWLRVDPVHLEVGPRAVCVTPLSQLPWDPAEAYALAAVVADVLARDGLTLESPHPLRWYLTLANSPSWRTAPPGVGEVSWPVGEGDQPWRTRLTEIQMCLHGHPANERRESAGLPTVNSVWLWGEGAVTSPLTAPVAEIASDDPWVRGLARWAGLSPHPLARDFAGLALTGAPWLVAPLALDGAGDLRALTEAWLAPAVAALDRGQIAGLVISTPGERRLIRRSLFRRWSHRHGG